MRDLTNVLTDILGGGAGGACTVLHNCRFDGAGASVYGREAILEQFRKQPCASEDVHLVRCRRFAALFARAEGRGVALFADLYGEHIARLWYLASTPLALRRASRVDVPFDPTFGQLAQSVAFDPADHPELMSEHVPRVMAMADGASMGRSTRLMRPRSFVLRAFSHGESTAVLAQVVALRSDGRPGLVQFPMAVCLRSDPPAEATVVVDESECEAAFSSDWRSVL